MLSPLNVITNVGLLLPLNQSWYNIRIIYGLDVRPVVLIYPIGVRLWEGPPRFLDTLAEGIRTQQVGHLTFPILVEHIEKEVFTVVSTPTHFIVGIHLENTCKYL